MRRDGDQALDAVRRSQRCRRCSERRGLFCQTSRIRARGKTDDRELVRMGAYDVKGAAPNRSRRPQNGEPFQKLYLTKT